jgi:simple sugar transport system substrate-binding protein
LLGVLGTAALLLGACGGQTSAPSSGASGGGPNIYLTGGHADDVFWSRVKRGADDAGLVVKAEGGSVNWLSPVTFDNMGPDMAKLMQTALNQGASGLITGDWVPAAQDPVLQQYAAAKIPFLLYNTGTIDMAKKLGALNYIGADDYTGGKVGGEYLGTMGAKHALCVNTIPGQTNSEARCKGLRDGLTESGGTSTDLPLPITTFQNATAVAQAVKAALVNDPTIDSVLTTGSVDATSAASGIDQAGLTGKVKLGTFDMDDANLQRIKAGTQTFCIDQQGYLQGYLAVSLMNGYIKWGINLPVSPIPTGPAIVDSSNVDTVAAGVKAGVR